MRAVSYPEVACTADSIVIEDEESPSVMRVREHLSNISPNDVYFHLARWRQEQSGVEASEPVVPSEIPYELSGIVRQAMARHAKAHAEKLEAELDQARDETMRLAMFGRFLEEDIGLITDELDAAEDTAHRAVEVMSDAEKRAEAAKAELAQAQAHVRHLEDRLSGKITVH